MARHSRHQQARAQRARRNGTPPRQVVQRREPGPLEQLAVAWVGVTFVGIAAAGLSFDPARRAVWLILLIFGAATIPQVTLWWVANRKRDRERGD